MRTALFLLLFSLTGCGNPTAKTVPPVAPPATKPVPPVAPLAPPPPDGVPKLGADAEPLPEPPKLDPANEHKPLTPDRSLLLETRADPANPGQRKPVRLLLECEVCRPAPTLEVLLCRTNTKEHEAILRTAIDARLLHSGLLALGLKPGAPVRFVDLNTGEPDYHPATGAKVAVTVHYRKDGKLHTHPAQEWLRDVKTKKPMAYDWVFAGSRFYPNPDGDDKPPYYAANNGEVIAVANFVESMLDIPVNLTADDAELAFEADYRRVPPPLSKVWVALAGVAVKPAAK